jgi:hypothetical protein
MVVMIPFDYSVEKTFFSCGAWRNFDDPQALLIAEYVFLGSSSADGSCCLRQLLVLWFLLT